ncbi:MAG: aminotransferase class I/II-fold pyridoxal phosphate-dependent enzyme [Steroidobacteraceae bacterium]|nr:aminotransferase class I/II-fold pyridoxal phosphate-dependent enzyme [Steroidobacteraceae bacterium]MDW8260637.1 histidinol-phosphate transaminase [Gammaproteobacteria bacterium]
MNTIDRRTLLTGAAVISALGTDRAWARKPLRESAAPAGPIRLSGNENPYGPGPKARAAIAANMNEACRYGFRPHAALIDKLAQREQVAKENLVLGAGSGELLHMLALVFAERREVVCAWPTFAQLMSYAEKLGAEIRKIPLDAELRHDLAALDAATTPNTALLYVCNPNNPTGTALPGPTLREFCRAAAQRTLVVVDEAYLELADDGATESMVDLVRDGANVVVLRTFSKLHGLAGLRVGYAIARADVIARLRRLQMTSVGTLGLLAASASLDDTEFLATTRKALLDDRRRLTALCSELGVRCANAQGNFVFVNVRMPATEFAKKMLAEGIEVARPFEPLVDWSRISIGTRVENERLFGALRTVLG